MVLLVDDDIHVLNAKKSLLEAYSYNVITARNAPEALELFSSFHEDIKYLITDYHMPNEDGIELIQTLRQHKPSLHAILISGGVIREEIPSNINYFTKPVRINTLVKALNEAESL